MKSLFYTKNPDTGSLRCKLLGDVSAHQGSATQSTGPNPVVKTSCTSLAFVPMIAALDTDGARRQFQTDFQPDQPPLPTTGRFFRRADPVAPHGQGHVLQEHGQGPPGTEPAARFCGATGSAPHLLREPSTQPAQSTALRDPTAPQPPA